MTIATWRPGYQPFKADAQKVADELRAIGDEVTPQQIVDRARDDSTELHKCFEWDNDKAADKYRLYQARQVMIHLVIKESVDKPDSVPVRVFHKTAEKEGYKPLEMVVRNEDEYTQLLARAWAELKAFKVKYQALSELSEIFALIA